MRTRLSVLALTLLSLASANALELPALVDDGMVVQRDEVIPVWGWATPGSEIAVWFDEQEFPAVTDGKGRWRVELPPLPAGGPHRLAIEGEGEAFAFDDIWVGDVWVCSGQSNMEWPLESTDNADAAIAGADDRLIRHFKVPKSWASSPREKLAGGAWQSASPATAGQFTAVGYYFARQLRSEVDVPIGLINATWGGSSIESWMDAPLLGLDPEQNEDALQSLEAAEVVEASRLREQYARWPDALSGGWEQAVADWSAADLDVTDWVEVEVPSLWEDAGFKGLDGVAWYRKSFHLSREQAGQDLELGLARIDDQDVTYLNGHEVGASRVYNAVRRYPVRHNVLREGLNTVAVRVFDSGGGGGIYAEPDLLYLKGDGVEISLAGTWLFRVDRGNVSVSADRNRTPTALYNRMLHPLFKVPVKGVLWYQGEENASALDRAFEYRHQFVSLITDWRAKWNNETLPFYWVQLANFVSGADTATASPWAVLRESQSEALRLPHTGQAVIIDVGDPADIHPRDKQTVGRRLALHALKNDYGKAGLVTDGPYALEARVDGNAVIVTFATASVLGLRQGETPWGFELADAQGNWHAATGVLRHNSVALTSDRVERPSGVRYAWGDNPENANLTDASGLPANPFRKKDL